jgi:hypothetical protein
VSYPAHQVRFEIERKDGEAVLATSIGVITRAIFGNPFVFVR